jgi:hypothetical protein
MGLWRNGEGKVNCFGGSLGFLLLADIPVLMVACEHGSDARFKNLLLRRHIRFRPGAGWEDGPTITGWWLLLLITVTSSARRYSARLLKVEEMKIFVVQYQD